MKTFYTSLLPVTVLLCTAAAFGQTPIVTVTVNNIPATGTASYSAAGANGSSLNGNTYNYTFGAATQTGYNLKDLNNFTIGSDVFNYSYTANSYVKIRRVDNPVVSGNRSLLWLESLATSDPARVAIVNPYKENMENIFDDNTFNAGTDNIFGNQGDGNGNNNNIERLDVIFPNGIKAAQNTKCGFAVFERGADNAHDPFVIAPITGIDSGGTPTAYGNLLRVTSIHYGNIPNTSLNYYIVRRDIAAESNLRVSTSGNQNIGGVFLSLNDLGIGNGIKIYGYSLFPLDLPLTATSTDLVDYTNATNFPQSTSSNTSLGGLDLLAITGLFTVTNAVIYPPIAQDITMAPIVQATDILPFIATAFNSAIASYTVQTIPAAQQGILSIYINGVLVPVTAGQVLTPNQINSMVFEPNVNFTGDATFTYSATDSNNSGSNIANYTIPVIAQQTGILPIHLLSFTGSIQKKTVELDWQTSQEINSSYFEIEKSTDGKIFETFATQTIKGNTGANNYQLTDDLFFYTYKTICYRLKMVYINGTYKYSPSIIIKLGDTDTKHIVNAWPAPFINSLHITYRSEATENVKINVTSLTGATVISTTSLVKKGNNVITINQAQSIPSGTYLLIISNSRKTETIKVMKD